MADFYVWSECKIPVDLEDYLSVIASLGKQSSTKDWMLCLDILEINCYSFYLCYTHENLENKMFPSKCWTFQHHCAFHTAPKEVIERMVELGFPMTLKDGLGKFPIDLVDCDMPAGYKKLFKPKSLCSKLTLQKLDKMDKIIHYLIKERSGNLLKEMPYFVLPSLSPYFEWMHYRDRADSIFMISINFHQFYIESEYNEDKSDVDAVIMSIGLNVKYKIKENTYELIESVFA